MNLPESIQSFLGSESFRLDAIGESGSQVLLFSNKVLKIQPKTPEAHREHRLLCWLQGKLPVPEVLAWEEEKDISYLLMSRLPGEMACSPSVMADPQKLARLLAQALKALWQVDISGCPADQRLPQKLAAAKYNVDHGLVDMDDTQPDTFGPNGFRDPKELLLWLQTHQPEEEPALTHGDFCLPNVFFADSRLSGFLDLGRGGIGDKWNDIAICYRSLRDNYSGRYASTPAVIYDDTHLFRELGMEPDWEKIRYYILLDELF